MDERYTAHLTWLKEPTCLLRIYMPGDTFEAMDPYVGLSLFRPSGARMRGEGFLVRERHPDRDLAVDGEAAARAVIQEMRRHGLRPELRGTNRPQRG